MECYKSLGEMYAAQHGVPYYGRSARDRHGGHAREHRAEMQQIAQETIERLVPPMVRQMCNEIWNAALQRLVGAIEYDVNTCVNVGFASGEEIFSSSKLKKVLSNAIMNSIKMELRGMKNVTVK